jgi:hypothetical protein
LKWINKGGMTWKKYAYAVFGAGVFIICSAVARSDQGGACVTCHEYLGGDLARPVMEWKGSLHQQNGITCDLCHGGNANVNVGDIKKLSARQLMERQSLAMSKSSGFVGKPSGKAMFDLCGECHGESVDRYSNSIMGKSYLRNKGGPSCIACHNAHNNTMPDVPGVCESCHINTTGFDQIDPMSVTESTVNDLSKIRVRLAEEKAKGKEPPFLPEFPEDLGSFQIGFVAFGAVVVLFVIGYLVYIVLEKRG